MKITLKNPFLLILLLTITFGGLYAKEVKKQGKNALDEWYKTTGYIITKGRFLCHEKEEFAKAFKKAYRGDNQGAHYYIKTHEGCMILNGWAPLKILKRDGNMRFVEYLIPFSNTMEGVTTGWTHVGYIITRDEFKKGGL